MPEICRFLGIIIAMYYQDHTPPHFHAKYGDHRASIAIESLKIIEGNLPKRVLSLVLEWAYDHRLELMGNWDRTRDKKPLQKIEPLI